MKESFLMFMIIFNLLENTSILRRQCVYWQLTNEVKNGNIFIIRIFLLVDECYYILKIITQNCIESEDTRKACNIYSKHNF